LGLGAFRNKKKEGEDEVRDSASSSFLKPYYCNKGKVNASAEELWVSGLRTGEVGKKLRGVATMPSGDNGNSSGRRKGRNVGGEGR